jgi:hypothetical protein
MAKDLFSKQSDLYARYRPTYPRELYDYILSFVKEKTLHGIVPPVMDRPLLCCQNI